MVFTRCRDVAWTPHFLSFISMRGSTFVSSFYFFHHISFVSLIAFPFVGVGPFCPLIYFFPYSSLFLLPFFVPILNPVATPRSTPSCVASSYVRDDSPYLEMRYMDYFRDRLDANQLAAISVLENAGTVRNKRHALERYNAGGVWKKRW